MMYVKYGSIMLLSIISMSIPIATLALLILIFNKVKKIEKSIGTQ